MAPIRAATAPATHDWQSEVLVMCSQECVQRQWHVVLRDSRRRGLQPGYSEQLASVLPKCTVLDSWQLKLLHRFHWLFVSSCLSAGGVRQV